MAAVVKTKTTIASISLAVLILIPLLEQNFFTPVVLTRWPGLSWDDFQGIPKPLSKYDASISTNIYLDYDSSLKRFRAYAAQNNVRSWVKKNYKPQELEYLLTHEQYHFNITEIVARGVDKLVLEDINNPGLDDTHQEQMSHSGRLIDGRRMLRSMQDNYDNETNHGTIFHQQKRWEFKIDSMLHTDSGRFVDVYSGASIFLPTKNQSTLKKWITPEGGKARDYQISAYAMSFRLLSMQHPNYTSDVLERLANEMQNEENTTLLELNLNEYPQTLLFRSVDSTGRKTYSSWTHEGTNLYYTGASFWGSKDTTGYYEIANSVIRSLKVVDLDTHTSGNAGESREPERSTLSNKRDPNSSYSSCFVGDYPEPVGFITKPTFDDEGGAFFSCDFSAAPDSLRYVDFIQIDDEMISVPPAHGQPFYVSPHHVAKGAHIMVGYFLKEDTTKKCFRAFREHVYLARRSEISN